MSSTPLTGSMCWNRSFHSWCLRWQCTSFPLPALCPHQTMRHQSTWSSAHRQSRLLLIIHHAQRPRQAACSRNSHQPDQVGPGGARRQEARQDCCLWLGEYRNAPAALYAPGECHAIPGHDDAWFLTSVWKWGSCLPHRVSQGIVLTDLGVACACYTCHHTTVAACKCMLVVSDGCTDAPVWVHAPVSEGLHMLSCS